MSVIDQLWAQVLIGPPVRWDDASRGTCGKRGQGAGGFGPRQGAGAAPCWWLRRTRGDAQRVRGHALGPSLRQSDTSRIVHTAKSNVIAWYHRRGVWTLEVLLTTIGDAHFVKAGDDTSWTVTRTATWSRAPVPTSRVHASGPAA